MESARTFLWLTCGVLIMFLFIEWSNPGSGQPLETSHESSLILATADTAGAVVYKRAIKIRAYPAD